MKAVHKGRSKLAYQLLPYVSLTQDETIVILKKSMHWKTTDWFMKLIHTLPEDETLLNDLLIKAISFNNKTAIKLLLQKGANPNAFNQYGQGTLHLAIKKEETDLEIIDLLVSAGANIEMLNQDQLSPINKAVLFGEVKVVQYFENLGIPLDENSLIKAVISNDETILNYLLSKNITPPLRAYYIAIFFDHYPAFFTLIKSHPPFTLTHNSQENPLSLAIFKRRFDIFHILMNHLPDDIHKRRKICSEALIHAVLNGDLHLVPLLLKNGADINFVSDGESILDIALTTKNSAAVTLIKNLGGRRYRVHQPVSELHK